MHGLIYVVTECGSGAYMGFMAGILQVVCGGAWRNKECVKPHFKRCSAKLGVTDAWLYLGCD